MGWREAAVRLLGFDVGQQGGERRTGERVREEIQRDDDRGWRTISPAGNGAGTERDPSLRSGETLTNWEQLLREAYEAYTTNPLAYAVIEQQCNFVLGGGARVEAEDARVQKVVDRFWHDPENRMDERIYAIQTELALFGEQFIRYFVDPVTGRVVIRQLDPLYVKAIETDPEDLERPLRYLYRLGLTPSPLIFSTFIREGGRRWGGVLKAEVAGAGEPGGTTEHARQIS